MDEQTNQLNDDDDRVSRIPEQWEIDEINMKDLNEANRFYRMCVAGKCPPPSDRAQKHAPKKNQKRFVSTKRQDKKLAAVWIDSGRARRTKLLEAELKEVRLQIAVASAKTHTDQQEKNFKEIKQIISKMNEMDVDISKAKSEITHLKSQIVRVDQKKQELNRASQSEDQFSTERRKANRTLEIYENRLQQARQTECKEIAENQKLRKLIEDMLFSRNAFNSFWSKTAKKVKDRRKFLLDMIERSSTAFNEGADTLDSYKKLQARRTADKDAHVTEMLKMERQIDANHIRDVFLGQKGRQRELAPLEAREVRRRENFKYDYGNRLDLYQNIIEKIQKVTGKDDVRKATDQYLREDNEGFQIYQFLNEMNRQVEVLSGKQNKTEIEILAMQNFHKQKQEMQEKRAEDLNNQLHVEINKTFAMKRECDKVDKEVAEHFEALMEIMKTLECDLTPVQHLLGNHEKITTHNLTEFFSILEVRLNEVLAVVYCDQRQSADILVENEKLVVKSLKRSEEKPVQIEDVITTQPCAECAKGELHLMDQKIVYPLDHDIVKENSRRKVETPEIDLRLHNLSKCNLPHSGVIAGRRFAE